MQEKVIIFNAYVYNIRMDVVFKKDSGANTTKFLSIKEKLVKFFKNYNSNFYYFLLLCGIGLLFFISSLFQNQFTTLFGGDYTAQQLSFYTNGYDDWWYFFKTGEFRFFDTNTYLGASNVGANSFYYLFDPFFLPILICPRAYIAQGMAILTIFKIATAGMFFKKYMTVMGASEKASRITAIAYAFCGWMSWFLWFNHMTEIMIVFPIMLWGIERVLRDKKPWLLMFGIFLMGLTNYFFLIGMGIAAFIYAIFRFIQRIKLNSPIENLKILGIGFSGFLGGLLLSCCVAVPAALYSLDAPRAANSGYLDTLKEALKTKDFKTVFGYLFSWKAIPNQGEYKHFYPLVSFVFPCASCRGTPLTQYGNEWYDNCATNTYSFIPMLLLFAPAFIKAMKEKKWSTIVATALFLVALETPFAYYMFFGFTAPYGRWELFFITSYLTFTGLYIDKIKDEPIWTDVVGYVFAIVATIGGGICANTIVTYYSDFQLRNEEITPVVGTLIVCAFITGEFITLFFLKKKDAYKKAMTIFIGVEAAIMGFLTIEGHWCGSFIDANNGLTYNTDIYQLNKQIEKKDKSYYRIWSYNQNEGARNDGMRNDYNGLGMFHSLYNFNLNSFVHWTKIQDGDPFYGGGCWSGSYVWKNPDIDKFLGVKYYFVQSNSPQWGWMNDGNTNNYQYNVPFEFEQVYNYKTQHYAVFEDTKHVDFAFGFDTLVTYGLRENSKVQADSVDFPVSSKGSLRNGEMLLEGAILEGSVANKIKEQHNDFTVTQARNIRGLKKSTLAGSTRLYDLQQPLTTEVGKGTVYTFFNPTPEWLGEGVHALSSAELVKVDEGLYQNVTNTEAENKIYGRYVQVMTPAFTGAFDESYDPDGYAIYVPYYYYDDYQADIYLVDTDNKIITWDRHQDDKYNEGGLRYRTFYVHATKNEDGTTKPAPRLNKIIIANRNIRTMGNSEFNAGIMFETATQFKTRTNSLYQYKVENVKYSKNASFSFETNFDKDIFVVTQMPYEKGWEVKANGKNLEVFSAQGGFVGFVAPKGQTKYKMKFYPANLQLGKYMSAVGAAMFLSTYYGYCFLVKNKELEEQYKNLFKLA